MPYSLERIGCKLLEGGPAIRAWDSYCDRQPAATPYHTPAWGRAVIEALGHECHTLSVAGAQGIAGVLPLFLRRSRFFGTNLVSVPAANECGVLADDDAAACRLVDGAIELARELGVDYVELRGVPAGSAGERLQSDPGRYVTVVVDLRDGEAEVWKQLKKRIRRRIRRAQEAGLAVEFGRDVDEYYPVYAATMKRLGSPPFAPLLFVRLLEHFGDRAMIAIARLGSVVAAVDFLVHFNGVQYSLFAGSRVKLWHLYPNQFLLWHEIRHSCTAGLLSFDLGRSLPDSGSLEFKLPWGGQTVPLTYAYHLNRARRLPVRTPDTFPYSALSRIWSHLPDGVATSLGPRLVRHLF